MSRYNFLKLGGWKLIRKLVQLNIYNIIIIQNNIHHDSEIPQKNPNLF